MRKISWVLCLVTILSILLAGCKKASDMPEDFHFSFQYGIEGRNGVNTYEDTITKDLIESGTKSIEFQIPKNDLEDIYYKIVELDITSITKKLASDTIMIMPLKEYNLIFTIDKKTYTISGDSTMNSLDENEQAKNFSTLVNYLTNYVESTSEYKSLPEAQGGYD